MGKGLVVSLAVSIGTMGTAVQAQEWTDWILVTNEDPLTDRVTYSLVSQEDRYSPAYVYLACNDERAWLAFSDGQYIAHSRSIPRVTVRFDDEEPQAIPFSDLRRNPAFLVHWESNVAWFADGLRTASRIAFRIDNGRTHSFSLSGAAGALVELEQGCALPELTE